MDVNNDVDENLIAMTLIKKLTDSLQIVIKSVDKNTDDIQRINNDIKVMLDSIQVYIEYVNTLSKLTQENTNCILEINSGSKQIQNSIDVLNKQVLIDVDLNDRYIEIIQEMIDKITVLENNQRYILTKIS